MFRLRIGEDHDHKGRPPVKLEGTVSHHLLPHRAVVASVAVTTALSLSCASGGPKDLSPKRPESPTDTSSIANGDGKSIENLFAGRFPGVTVSRTDNGGLQIRIRGGSNTFYGSDEPLFVVDDIPLPAGTGGILHLNPYDIQKIEVLKNPADIALYGMRGGNGVIKITTRKPGVR
ncbi:MAG: TonB-dependent receptor plug domain-containing protein [Gemmatimonadaceae bacterium]